MAAIQQLAQLSHNLVKQLEETESLVCEVAGKVDLESANLASSQLSSLVIELSSLSSQLFQISRPTAADLEGDSKEEFTASGSGDDAKRSPQQSMSFSKQATNRRRSVTWDQTSEGQFRRPSITSVQSQNYDSAEVSPSYAYSDPQRSIRFNREQDEDEANRVLQNTFSAQPSFRFPSLANQPGNSTDQSMFDVRRRLSRLGSCVSLFSGDDERSEKSHETSPDGVRELAIEPMRSDSRRQSRAMSFRDLLAQRNNGPTFSLLASRTTDILLSPVDHNEIMNKLLEMFADDLASHGWPFSIANRVNDPDFDVLTYATQVEDTPSARRLVEEGSDELRRRRHHNRSPAAMEASDRVITRNSSNMTLPPPEQASEAKDRCSEHIAERHVFLSVVLSIFLQYRFIATFKIEIGKFVDFIDTVFWLYGARTAMNPFHSSLKAADMVHGVHTILMQPHIGQNLTDLELFCTLFAALMVDVGHLGVTNEFLALIDHPISQLFVANPQESVSAALTCALLRKPQFCFFEREWWEAPSSNAGATNRLVVEEMVTDIIVASAQKNHLNLVNDANDVFALGAAEVAAHTRGRKTERQQSPGFSFLSSQEQDSVEPVPLDVPALTPLQQSPENPVGIPQNSTPGTVAPSATVRISDLPKLLKSIVHLVDMRFTMRPLDSFSSWIWLWLDEHTRQGDEEEARGLQVSYQCRRNSHPVDYLERFLRCVALPLANVLTPVLPKNWKSNLIDNIASFGIPHGEPNFLRPIFPYVAAGLDVQNDPDLVLPEVTRWRDGSAYVLELLGLSGQSVDVSIFLALQKMAARPNSADEMLDLVNRTRPALLGRSAPFDSKKEADDCLRSILKMESPSAAFPLHLQNGVHPMLVSLIHMTEERTPSPVRGTGSSPLKLSRRSPYSITPTYNRSGN